MKYITILLCVLFAGCSISGDDLQRAIELCEPNGGINVIHVDLMVNFVYCNNEARFEL